MAHKVEEEHIPAEPVFKEDTKIIIMPGRNITCEKLPGWRFLCNAGDPKALKKLLRCTADRNTCVEGAERGSEEFKNCNRGFLQCLRPKEAYGLESRPKKLRRPSIPPSRPTRPGVNGTTLNSPSFKPFAKMFGKPGKLTHKTEVVAVQPEVTEEANETNLESTPLDIEEDHDATKSF